MTLFDVFVFVWLSLAGLQVALFQAILGSRYDDSARSGAGQKATRKAEPYSAKPVMEIPLNTPEIMKYSEKQQLSYISDRWEGCAYLQHPLEKQLRLSFTSQV
jgi:hypothetical protein